MTGDEVALCGAGWIGAVHAAAIGAAGFELTAVASRSPERAARAGGEVAHAAPSAATTSPPAPTSSSSPPRRSTTPPRPSASSRPARRCVLEKPLCRTLAEADAIVAAAAAHGERLLYAENLAYAPAFGRDGRARRRDRTA